MNIFQRPFPQMRPFRHKNYHNVYIQLESDRNSVSVFGFGDKSSRMWTFGAYSVSAEYEAKFFGFRPNNGCCIRSTPIAVSTARLQSWKMIALRGQLQCLAITRRFHLCVPCLWLAADCSRWPEIHWYLFIPSFNLMTVHWSGYWTGLCFILSLCVIYSCHCLSAHSPINAHILQLFAWLSVIASIYRTCKCAI